jgi:hypothetical protein
MIGKETLKSFFVVSGEEGSFIYKKGCERIPENWYHRPIPYGFANYAIDLVSWAEKYPLLLKYTPSFPQLQSKDSHIPALVAILAK